MEIYKVDTDRLLKLLSTFPISHSQVMEVFSVLGYTVSMKKSKDLLNADGEWIGVETVTRITHL